MAPKKSSSKTMSDEHKAALAEGRRQGRAVARYLEALESNRPRRGRKRTPESIERKLTEINSQIDDAGPARRLELLQQRRDLERELEQLRARVGAADLEKLQQQFVAVAHEYGQRKGIEYATWREAGVSPAVLKAAGISRGSG